MFGLFGTRLDGRLFASPTVPLIQLPQIAPLCSHVYGGELWARGMTLQLPLPTESAPVAAEGRMQPKCATLLVGNMRAAELRIRLSTH
jgi:hypothetical protein